MESDRKEYRVRPDEAVSLYSDMVYRISLAITGNTEDAMDVYQETFLRLVKNQDKITGEEHLKAWLIRVASNCAKSVAASAWNRSTQGIDEQTPDRTCETAAEGSDLLQTLRELPQKYSLVLYLYYYEEYSIKEISVLLEEKENSIKTRLARGRRLLRRKLEKGGRSRE